MSSALTCSTSNAPWYIVPADDKENARLIVSQIIVDTLGKLDLRYPESTAKRRRELSEIRTQLDSEYTSSSSLHLT
ncbi:hypothetical protein LJR267_009289 [Paraburkholderia hospita]|uniref:hypothetical protein n=1 Tax=Paraburkholderia hospita TaxID=169430 RepID=UPI003ED04E82